MNDRTDACEARCTILLAVAAPIWVAGQTSNFMGGTPAAVDATKVRTTRLKFPKGSRSNWHSHTWGQLLMLEEGQRAHAGARRPGDGDGPGPAVVDGRRRRALARRRARSGRAAADDLRRRREVARAGAPISSTWRRRRNEPSARSRPRRSAACLARGRRGLTAAAPQAPRRRARSSRATARPATTAPTGSRAPSPEILRRRSPEAILSALTAGGMRPQGGRLSGAERRAVAEYLSGRALGGDITGAADRPLHRVVAALAIRRRSPAWSGWSPSTTQHPIPDRPQQAGLTAEQVPKLSLKWAFGFPDATSAWSQPTVAGGRAVRRQPERHRLRARREERLHPLDVHGEERRAHGAVVRRATDASGYARVLRRHRRERLRARRGDRTRALDAPARRASATRASPDRRRSIRTGCSCRCRRSRRPRRASRATSAARSAAA